MRRTSHSRDEEEMLACRRWFDAVHEDNVHPDVIAQGPGVVCPEAF